MIAYEELQRALAKWKSRRTGAGDGSDGVPEGEAPAAAPEASYPPPPDATGELDLSDAEVDEA